VTQPLVASIVHGPEDGASPLVFDSPHSGMVWPPDFETCASRASILSTWDAWVDDLWSGARSIGAPLVAARFPRAYIDANRARTDLDEAIVEHGWPEPLEPTAYCQRGMGLIRRLALPDEPMYTTRLTHAAVKHRITAYHQPYRDAVASLLERAAARHGVACLVDCHSMKSRGNRMNVDSGAARPDFVVSDREGTTADPALAAWLAAFLSDRGYVVQVNDPYKGGDLVRTFGHPDRRRHAVQVEINRACYMDETAVVRNEGFERVRADLTALIVALDQHVRDTMRVSPA